jgi:two-component system, NtrC family, sensor kinase
MLSNNDSSRINYIVGEEKRLTEILTDSDIMPLLTGVITAGATSAIVTDEKGAVLWGCGSGTGGESGEISLPVTLEGEVVGSVIVSGGRSFADNLKGVAELLLQAVGIILFNKLKRMLTTEVHASVVNRSYEDLLETNRKLTVSERNYRELAINLEKIVEERTVELKAAHCRLLQQDKMAGIGQLAAGIAHEINNPMGFITSNLKTLGKYVGRFRSMLDFYRTSIGEATSRQALLESAGNKWMELKLDVVSSDVSDLILQSLEGAERVAKIVSDLRGFSHVDDLEQRSVDLNSEIDRTLNVLTHEIAGEAGIVRDFGDLPGFVCNPALMCQVFLNLVLNAVQACPDGLRLVIGTRHDGENIKVVFADNGPGIPEEIRHRIFEPFYTTKEVGCGTGMGLTVAYDIISGYGGSISLDCPDGGGSVFTITLPARGNG